MDQTPDQEGAMSRGRGDQPLPFVTSLQSKRYDKLIKAIKAIIPPCLFRPKGQGTDIPFPFPAQPAPALHLNNEPKLLLLFCH